MDQRISLTAFQWSLDVLVCNWLGLYIGMETVKYFSMKTYHWRGIQEIPNVRGKVSRSLQQFLPHSFTSFQWGPTKSFKNFAFILVILVLFLECELNAFYLKYLMWIPPNHSLNIIRLCLYVAMGAVSFREGYQLLSDRKCKRLGTQAWVCVACIIIETLICVKFGKDEFTEPMPTHISVFWVLFSLALCSYAFYQFFWKRRQPSSNKRA